VHVIGMKTSVTLDDDVYKLASLYAGSKGITLGAAIGELLRKGQGAWPTESVSKEVKRAANGLLVFAAGMDRRPITPEMVKSLQEEVD